MTRARSAGPRPVGPGGPGVASLLSLLGLATVLVASVALFSGSLPLSGSSSGSESPDPGDLGPIRTPTPSNVVVIPPDPRSTVPGTIAYVKSGAIWLQSGTEAEPLTEGPADAMPAWSTDGQWLYFVRTREEPGTFPAQGEARTYLLTYPNLIRVPMAGGEPERVATGRYKRGDYTWFYWLRQPAPAPDGRTVMLVSDAPDPLKSNVVLQSLSLRTGKLSRIKATEQPPLGHQDPTWRADGKLLLYVRNQREGLRGTPQITRYNPETKRTAVLSSPGYTSPSYSPDAAFVAATRTSTFGTDVVILDARTGAEVVRVTDDGASFKPAWSPRGDAIVFLRMVGGVTDLIMTTLEASGGVPRPVEEILLTDAAGLDPESRPTWYIPPEELPATPAPSPSSGASPASSPSP